MSWRCLLFEGFSEVVFIYELPSAGIDEECAGFHHSQCFCIDNAAGLCG